ncbi:MAG: hypothetical protein LRY54_02965 [Alphaproteobacteria bacterium]|nr:hypothetical protein [Alphaproteobacteria bacterium]
MAIAPQGAQAQETYDQLTEDAVKSFVMQTSEITNRNAKDLGDNEAKNYFEAHLHPSARFKSKIVYVIPGYPDKEAEIALNKTEFIDSLAGGSEAVDKYSNEIKIKGVKIAASGKSANVSTESTEEGEMNVEGEKVPMIGVSKCDQIIMLSNEGVIQMFNANCKTEIRFKD